MLKDGFCKLKKTTTIKQQLLDTYPDVSSPQQSLPTISSGSSSSNSSNIKIEKRGATDYSIIGSSPSRKSKLSSSSSASTSKASSSSTSNGGNSSSTIQSVNCYNIHDRLRELYFELLCDENYEGKKVFICLEHCSVFLRYYFSSIYWFLY